METSAATPRINGNSLSQHLGRSVVLICDVTHGHPAGQNMFQVKSADGLDLFISLPPGENFHGCQFVQVEGKVSKPNFVEVYKMQPVSPGFDVKNYNAAMALASGQYSHLFV